MTSYKIEFEPIGRRGECPSNKSILDCALTLGIGIASVCGSQGTCQSCMVQVIEGKTSEHTSSECNAFSAEELKAGWRLACQVYPLSDCKLYTPVESMTTPQRLQTEGLEVTARLQPCRYKSHSTSVVNRVTTLRLSGRLCNHDGPFRQGRRPCPIGPDGMPEYPGSGAHMIGDHRR